VHSFKRDTWGYFSAVCFATGAALLRDTGRPQGMLETCWGGTPIESWTPNENATDGLVGSSKAAGGLYNGMIAPYLQVPIKGALWYQGESNAHNYNPYAQKMIDMIADWRQNWDIPPTLKNFTFILHQLSAYGQGDNNNVIIPGLRWSQQGSIAPWVSNPHLIIT
jgi:sialate O-acetylesterase